MIAIQQSGVVVVVLARPPWRVPLATPALARAYAELVRRPAAVGRLLPLVGAWSDIAALALESIAGQTPCDRLRLAGEIDLAAELVEASWHHERVSLAPGRGGAG
jgi:hypothetical protein